MVRILVGMVLGLVAAVAASALAGAAEPTEVELELVRLEASSRYDLWIGTDDFNAWAHGQVVAVALGEAAAECGHTRRLHEDFARLVRREPQYRAAEPVRAVVEFGGRKFPLVLEQSDPGEGDYDLLRFDTAGSGDLTAPPVKARNGDRAAGFDRIEFPPVTIRTGEDDGPFEYAFVLSVHVDTGYSYQAYGPPSSDPRGEGDEELRPREPVQVALLFETAAYRAGTFLLDGEEIRVALVDLNTDGRFDDFPAPREDEAGAEVPDHRDAFDFGSSEPGVAIVFNPQFETADSPWMGQGAWIRGDHGQYLARLLSLEGAFYDVEVTPSGDRLTLRPTRLPLGAFTNPHDGFRVALSGEYGPLHLGGEANVAVPLPAGRWRLVSYTLQPPEPEQPQRSVMGALGRAFSSALAPGMGAPHRASTRLQAYLPSDTPALEIAAGETTPVSFGPPLKPVVNASWRRNYQIVMGEDGPGRVEAEQPGPRLLDLSLVFLGTAGERVQNITVRGSRPPAPQFEVIDPGGEVVVSGVFRYG